MYILLLLLLNNFSISVNVGDDSPVFEGLFEYCGLSAGGSMGKMKENNPSYCLLITLYRGSGSFEPWFMRYCH